MARRAAANSEHPEEGASKRKRRSNPDGDHEPLVELALGTILAGNRLDGAHHNDSNTGRQCSETAHGGGCDAGD